MLKSIKRLAIVATLVAAAVIPSAATARPVGPDQPYFDGAAAVQTATPAPARPESGTSVSSFSWHDAAVGAAATLFVVGIGTGAALAVRRRAILS